MSPRPPIVLSIGGHDPSGGAGIQADIEAIVAQGAWVQTAITALTIQDSCGLRRTMPVPARDLGEQIALLLADARIPVLKVGMVADLDQVEVIAGAIGDRLLIWDPVLAPSRGRTFMDDTLRSALLRELLPRTTLITPNSPEARRLTGHEDLDDCAAALQALGCRNVLVTGGHEPGARIRHRLYLADGARRESTWPRLPGEYHGSGCTLAAAIAARMALGEGVGEAVDGALAYTWQALQRARRLGRCQYSPDRLHAWR